MATYLTTSDLAKRYKKPPGTLRYWRSCNVGPRSFRLGRTVVYDLEDVEAWEREQRRVTGRGGVEATPGRVSESRSA